MRPSQGIISGQVLKLVRDSTAVTQERLAGILHVTRATIQGWESGRRPLGAMSVHQSHAVRQRLAQVGAIPSLVDLLDVAIQADCYLDAIIHATNRCAEPAGHPLGNLVLTHTLAELISWPITGHIPQVIASNLRPRTRPAPRIPRPPPLTPDQRTAYFDGLHMVAVNTLRHPTDASQVLAHRQACYLASVDPAGRDILQLRRTRADPSTRTWTPLWAQTRSEVVALARQGDRERLRAFISAGLDDSTVALAHLNYHAYWTGEVPGFQYGDTFMVDSGLAWRGHRLLDHLTERLTADHGFVDLNVHVLWLLLASRPSLARGNLVAARTLWRQSEVLLDTDGLSGRGRRELSEIRYSLRATGVQP